MEEQTVQKASRNCTTANIAVLTHQQTYSDVIQSVLMKIQVETITKMCLSSRDVFKKL